MGVPAIVRDQLRTEYWRNVQANAQLRAAASELFAALNARGIVPMLLKGGCQLFDPPGGNAGTRFMVDLDLLAPPGQDGISFDTVCQLGFVPAEDRDNDRSPHHWPKLSRPVDGSDNGLAVEIHKTPWLQGGTAEAELFFAASIPLKSTAGNARLPCTAHRLVHNAVHALGTHRVLGSGSRANSTMRLDGPICGNCSILSNCATFEAPQWTGADWWPTQIVSAAVPTCSNGAFWPVSYSPCPCRMKWRGGTSIGRNGGRSEDGAATSRGPSSGRRDCSSLCGGKRDCSRPCGG